MNLVLDSSAIVALLREEEGADTVKMLLDDQNNVTYMHAVNLCEVYYGIHRGAGESAAVQVIETIYSMKVTVREDMDSSFWQQAGVYKSDLHRVSLADCFCITLANRLDAELVTADHHELDKVAAKDLCRIRFIR